MRGFGERGDVDDTAVGVETLEGFEGPVGVSVFAVVVVLDDHEPLPVGEGKVFTSTGQGECCSGW